MTAHTAESIMEMAFDYRTASGNGEVISKRLALMHALEMTFFEMQRLQGLVSEQSDG